MERSIILMFIKFFDECMISKRMKRVKNWLQFIVGLLYVIFCGIFTYIVVSITDKDVSNSIIVCMSIIYGALIIMTIYFKESMTIVFLFSNEYFLMKIIKEYLGKIFKDIYLSYVADDKIVNHIHTLSYYIANFYDLQRIKSQNNLIISNKIASLSCTEFLYFIENKLKYNDKPGYSLHLYDLNSEQIANIIFNILNTEYENSKGMGLDSEICIELNAFLSSKFGRKFIDDTVIYASSTFNDYECSEWWLYNKLYLPVLKHNPHYRRHIKDNKDHCEKIIKSKENKKEKSYLSWIDDI